MSTREPTRGSTEHAAGGKTPAVSWLLCSHVVNDQLRAALGSCLDQTFEDFELLVVANGPRASEVAAAVQAWYGADPRLRVITTETHHLTFSLSLGLHHARAELVARMDSDDLSTSDRLERQVDFMRNHPDVVVLGSAYTLIDDDGRHIRTVSLPTSNAAIRRGLLRGNPICHPSTIFRRSAILAAGGYLGWLLAEDYDLWSRLACDPANVFANLPEVLTFYRANGVGIARRARGAYASMAASQFRNFAMGEGAEWGAAAMVSTLKAVVSSMHRKPGTGRGS
jgi:glycosyltransferase involved in cell wall biosynthesis